MPMIWHEPRNRLGFCVISIHMLGHPASCADAQDQRANGQVDRGEGDRFNDEVEQKGTTLQSLALDSPRSIGSPRESDVCFSTRFILRAKANSQLDSFPGGERVSCDKVRLVLFFYFSSHQSLDQSFVDFAKAAGKIGSNRFQLNSK